jgi:hypothetical protein
MMIWFTVSFTSSNTVYIPKAAMEKDDLLFIICFFMPFIYLPVCTHGAYYQSHLPGYHQLNENRL